MQDDKVGALFSEPTGAQNIGFYHLDVLTVQNHSSFLRGPREKQNGMRPLGECSGDRPGAGGCSAAEISDIANLDKVHPRQTFCPERQRHFRKNA